MGTNYYAIPKATEELRKRIISAVERGDFINAKIMIPDKIHIGKSSGGWQFCFNHNDWEYFEKNRESIEVFLLSCEIFDEYDMCISNYDFWQMVEAKKQGKAHLTWNGHECGFIEAGLNFSNSINFS